jgi:hypothetical protein
MNQTKNQKVEMNLNVSNVDGIKLVKNSSVFAKDGYVYAVHYGTVIFQYNMNTNETLINLNCSTTSNRLIRRCLSFYNVLEEDAINTHEGGKWNYSGNFE